MAKNPNLIEINGVVDENDYNHIVERFGEPKEAHPAPETFKGEWKINPHESKFILQDGRDVSVFHIKPIYYATPDRKWRPLSEVAHEYGNSHLNLKADWHTKMDKEYLKWLDKRLKLINKGNGKNQFVKETDPVTKEKKNKYEKGIKVEGVHKKIEELI